MPGRSVVCWWGKLGVRSGRRGTWLPRARRGVRLLLLLLHPRSRGGPESVNFLAQLEQLGVYLVRCDGVDQRTQLLDITGSFGVGLLPVTFASRSW